MFKPINEDTDLLLWDANMVQIRRNGDKTEIVAHPARNAKISVRVAKEPYVCTLHLADGDEVNADLGCEEDWGDIQGCLPTDCDDWKNSLGWGNDVDGHRKIVKVTDADGKEIPLEEFRYDVEDFIVYFAA